LYPSESGLQPRFERLTYMRELSPDAVILSGAGISVGSGLPDGQQLARLAFRGVSGPALLPLGSRMAVASALSWRAGREPRLRLELLLELMSRDVPLKVLAGVYSAVLGAEPNSVHAAVVASGLASVTANQDELLEACRTAIGTDGPEVLHLHGRASVPSTIMTTIGQYSAGLPRRVAQKFQALVEGRDVLVVGYSGRDLDIMPTLYSASRITWLQWVKPGFKPGALSVEAARLQTHLSDRFKLVPVTDVAAWLTRRLPAAARRTVRSWPQPAARTVRTLPADAAVAFAALDDLDRHVAVARVLMQVGRPETALRILGPWIRGSRLHAVAALRAAEAQQMLGDRRAALHLYRAAVANADDARVEASALLGVAHVHANSGRYRQALTALDSMSEATDRITSRRLRLDAQTKAAAARGRIETSIGDDTAALRSYRTAIRDATTNGDLGQRLSALVMGSDVYRSIGKPLASIAQLEQAFADNLLYTRPYSSMWAYYYRGLARCVCGDLGGGRTDLLECLDRGRRTNNLQAVAWAQVTLSSFHLHDDPARAKRYAEDCQFSIDRYGRMPLCQIRLDWQLAELARAHGDLLAARAALRPVRGRLRSAPLTHGAAYMWPHVHAMEAEMARSEARPDTIRLIDAAAAEFRAGGWRQQVARMQVSRWLASGSPAAPKALIERCERYGYGLELTVLQGAPASLDYLPLHPL
jgi:tetratricopeptide (TPR) repeat protein